MLVIDQFNYIFDVIYRNMTAVWCCCCCYYLLLICTQYRITGRALDDNQLMHEHLLLYNICLDNFIEPLYLQMHAQFISYRQSFHFYFHDCSFSVIDAFMINMKLISYSYFKIFMLNENIFIYCACKRLFTCTQLKKFRINEVRLHLFGT